MEMLTNLGWVLIYFFIPIVIIFLCQKHKGFKKIGDVILAYFVGLVLGHSGLLPESLVAVQEILISVTIPLAIPLMLFGTDVRSWFKMAPQTLWALITGLAALTFMVVSGYFMFAEKGDMEMAKVGGLFMGLYSGGTPNLAALQFILKTEEEVYLAVNAYDMAVGSGYLFFLLSVGHRFFGLFLPDYRSVKITQKVGTHVEGDEPFWGLFAKKRRLSLLAALGLAVLVFAVSAFVMTLVVEKSKMAVLVLSITSLGIVLSFNKKVREIDRSFELGMYFILVFSVVIASKVNVAHLIILDPKLIYYMTYVVFGTLLLHALLAILFRIDRDTLMVSSTALVCSPPFVPVVSSAIGNRQVLVAGLTVGLIGYAIGNYLGMLVYHLLLNLAH